MDLDPRLVFYLEHREQIDEWLQLPKLEAEAADHFFAGEVSDAIEVLPGTLPGEPRCFRAREDRWRKTFLYLDHWPLDEFGGPLVGIGLEWTASTGFLKAYVGIRVDIRPDRARNLYRKVDERLGSVRERLDGTLDGLLLNRSTQYWPLWVYLEPPPRFWEDLPGLSDRIAGHVDSLWSHAWQGVDQAVRDWRSNP